MVQRVVLWVVMVLLMVAAYLAAASAVAVVIYTHHGAAWMLVGLASVFLATLGLIEVFKRQRAQANARRALAAMQIHSNATGASSHEIQSSPDEPDRNPSRSARDPWALAALGLGLTLAIGPKRVMRYARAIVDAYGTIARAIQDRHVDTAPKE